MKSSLLSTKLFLPAPGSNLVPRQRLIWLLNAGLNRKLTLVSAPAGFGKSTLLSAWTRQVEECVSEKTPKRAPQKMQVAWLSLDEGDNDLVRFFDLFRGRLTDN